VVTRTFLHPGAAPDLSFAFHEVSGDITPALIASLPKPDLALDRPAPAIQYTHRSWADADLYFVSTKAMKSDAGRTRGWPRQAQIWDLATGLIHPMRDATSQPDGVRLPLTLAPYEARVIVIGRCRKMQRCRAFARDAKTVMDLAAIRRRQGHTGKNSRSMQSRLVRGCGSNAESFTMLRA